MKKKYSPYKSGSYVFKILLCMRLTLFLILLNILGVYAKETYSQNFTLDYKNTSIKQVLEDIKKQSNLEFFYSNDDFDTSVEIDISVKNGTLDDVLEEILPSGMQYRVVDNTVIISKNNTKKTAPLQQQPNIIKGKVTDPDGLPLPGATITIVGTTKGVITDNDGVYYIEANPTDKLVFSFVGMESQIVDVGNQKTIDIEMGEKVDELEEVTVVAFGKQRKESVISSIETIKTDELRVPSSNLTTAFAGRMAGMISYQTSGEPGQDNAEFFIRGVTSFGTGKVDPLILIDNVEMTTNDLSRLHPDDIASFSILKDATATALYGARAANGVILITTKEGEEGKIKVSFRLENSFSFPTTEIEMADPIIYMRMANEAAKTRDPLAGLLYREEKIDNTIRKTNPYVYPSQDWMNILFKDVTMNQKANMNISGGDKIVQYYIAGSFTQDNGILKVEQKNNFNNNINLRKFLIRSNITINLTKTTKAKIRVHGTFDDYNGPIPGGSQLYRNALNVSPVRFPAYYAKDENFKYEQHTLFGNDEGGSFLNPYADMVSGYREQSKTLMLAQFELEQDFSQWIDGLTARMLGNTTRYSNFDLSRSFNPFFYDVMSYNREEDSYLLNELNTEEGTEYLSYSPGDKAINSSFYGELSAAYNRTFNSHSVSGMLVLIGRNELTANAPSLSESLPKRNLGLSGRLTYGFDNRYLGEFNFGYNGSEKFDKGHRWGFFPSVGLGWHISNEKFWTSEIANIISKFKIKGTYGMVGNDNIGAERFFYLSRVNIGGGRSYTTGYDYGNTRSGVSINNYENSQIGWEVSYKTNLGIEMGLLDGKIDILTDIFSEHRTNILQPRADIPVEMGLWATPQANVGEAKGRGVDISLDYNQIINNFWFVGRGTFTYARSTFKEYEEPDFSETPWRSRIGRPIAQRWGYYAERLFIDEEDVLNSPRQDFGEYGPGDIKYKDINKDGIINETDLVPIGFPVRPEINYGFGLSSGYKGLDASFFFQGSGRSSFWINSEAMSPFVRSGQTETGLARFIADNYWSERTQNPYSNWPRLSTYQIGNNNQRSTWFMRNGSFLRLKSVELGYALPESLTNKLKLHSCRFYLNGTNLWLWSKFDLWDVEMGGNGLGYPLQRVFNLGVNISF